MGEAKRRHALSEAQSEAMTATCARLIASATEDAKSCGSINPEAWAITALGEAYAYGVAQAIGSGPYGARAAEATQFALESILSAITANLWRMAEGETVQ